MAGHGLEEWPQAGVRRGVWAHPRSGLAPLCLPPRLSLVGSPHERMHFRFRFSLIQDASSPCDPWVLGKLLFSVFPFSRGSERQAEDDESLVSESSLSVMVWEGDQQKAGEKEGRRDIPVVSVGQPVVLPASFLVFWIPP